MVFNKIRGQEQAVKRLEAILESNRIGHAYLFSGPSGVGKRTCAELFSSSFNCEKRIIEPDKGLIKIDQIRKMQQDIVLTTDHDYKIYIIDEAEKMNEASSNCLLKTLEEPPSKSMIILLTSSPYQLLTTIRSRCQTIYFTALNEADMLDILEEKNLSWSEEFKRKAIHLAEGSLGRAIHFYEGEKNYALVKKIDLVWWITEACVNKQARDVFRLADDLLVKLDKTQGRLDDQGKKALDERLFLLAGCYRDLLIYPKLDHSSDLLLYKNKQDVIRRLSLRILPEEVKSCMRIIQDTNRDLVHMSRLKDISLNMENLFLRLCERR